MHRRADLELLASLNCRASLPAEYEPPREAARAGASSDLGGGRAAGRAAPSPAFSSDGGARYRCRLTIRCFLLGHVVGGLGGVLLRVRRGRGRQCIGLRAVGARPAAHAHALVQIRTYLRGKIDSFRHTRGDGAQTRRRRRPPVSIILHFTLGNI
ncbi:hypothetical protein EVAR_82285_1 [Eumeta japonica]|uniref:Uncharacterized protein n=1 Tax=Eumeta variegata TaxID=151549 RepID=A0A4C1VYI2_EUMVA|nr:hypothetical protein EVAR_82285_1 [Eumeta japonica]